MHSFISRYFRFMFLACTVAIASANTSASSTLEQAYEDLVEAISIKNSAQQLFNDAERALENAVSEYDNLFNDCTISVCGQPLDPFDSAVASASADLAATTAMLNVAEAEKDLALAEYVFLVDELDRDPTNPALIEAKYIAVQTFSEANNNFSAAADSFAAAVGALNDAQDALSDAQDALAAAQETINAAEDNLIAAIENLPLAEADYLDALDNYLSYGGTLDDTDNDSVFDSVDNCPATSNTDQADANNDGIGDACNPVNDNPATISGDLSASINISGYTFGTLTASDVDGLTDGSYFSITIPPVNGQALISSSSGTWTYIANNFYTGNDPFTVTVTDDSGGATQQIISIIVGNDTDADGVYDHQDNCPSILNPNQSNIDGDSFGDACDNDIDGDNVTNTIEIAYGTDPNDPSDGADAELRVLEASTLEEVEIPAMGSIGLLALGLSMLGLGAVRSRQKQKLF